LGAPATDQGKSAAQFSLHNLVMCAARERSKPPPSENAMEGVVSVSEDHPRKDERTHDHSKCEECKVQMHSDS